MANKYLDDNGLLYFWQQLKTLFAGKVDVVSGKGLSTNDFTNADKTKLDGIEAGAEANVNADWDAVTGDAAILNKPAIPTKTSDLTNDGDGTSNFATEAYADAHGGAIDVIKVNGTTQTITNKTVDLAVAELDSPAFTGTPTAPTAAAGTSTTQIATTAYVQGELTDYAKKSDLANVYTYKGSVATYSQLPASGQTAGDVYNVEADGMNYAWTGSAWDALGGSFSITSITNAEIDAIMAQ